MTTHKETITDKPLIQRLSAKMIGLLNPRAFQREHMIILP